MRDIKITIQETTNSSIIKFNANKILINGGSNEYNNIDEAKDSPLAQKLFYLPFVKKVFVTANFIAIQSFDLIEWKDVQEEVKEQIEAYLKSGKKVIADGVSRKKEAVEVYAEATPNPSVMKFATNKSLTQKNIEYKNLDEAKNSSPFAVDIFNFPFVKEVFISNNYISITKNDDVEWEGVFTEIRNFIREYLLSEKPVFNENLDENNKTISSKHSSYEVKLDDVSKKIIDILDEYIKPAVARDGGNITFSSYDKESKVVSVFLQGACSGCPSSIYTLKSGIENILKQMLPNQINEVVAING